MMSNLIPGTPMEELSAEKQALLRRLSDGLSVQQLCWLGGYFTGLAGTGGDGGGVAAGGSEGEGLTVLFGSQTGNGEGLARQLEAAARQRGLPTVVKSMGDYKTTGLKREKNLAVIVSTHGEGDPPDTAVELHEFLYGKRAPKLDGVRFAVLALGDTSYEEFCKTGSDFDDRLGVLGAERVLPRVDCDVDYEEAAAGWIGAIVEAFADLSRSGGSGLPVRVTGPEAAVGAAEFSKTKPFPAEVLECINLNGRGSDKETYHVEVSLENSGLTYQPGDSLGVYPTNNPSVVDSLLLAARLDGDAPVGEASLRDELTHRYEITILTRPVVAKYLELGASRALAELLDPGSKDALRDYLHGRDLVDLVTDFPIQDLAAADFAGILRKLPPRLYSIASSHDAHPEEAHLTIAAVRYHSHGRDREGVASTFFADRLADDARVRVYINPNPNFRLPADPSAPVILIGPGTGVAPFRAFLEQRELEGATGRNWLFFGDQHFTTDFLYQSEWLQFLKDGILTRMDVAFSRDQEHKIYVQDRMRERARDLYQWLQDGASLYVCGDESRMAKDVDATLHAIVAAEGGLDPDQSVDYVKTLHREKRYQRDVY